MAADTARVRSSEELEALRQALESMRASLDDPSAFGASDVRFHDIVMEISGNRLAESIARSLFERARDSARYHGMTPPSFQSRRCASTKPCSRRSRPAPPRQPSTRCTRTSSTPGSAAGCPTTRAPSRAARRCSGALRVRTSECDERDLHGGDPVGSEDGEPFVSVEDASLHPDAVLKPQFADAIDLDV